MPAIPTVLVVSTSVLQHETQGSLLARPHPSSQLASSLPVHTSAPAHTALVGSIIGPLSRYVASCNHFENWNLGFTDMELESEAQLLDALPPLIRRHQTQTYTLGTGVVDTRSQIDVGQGASTQIQCQQQTVPVYLEYSFDCDSTYVSVPAQPHKYQPTQACTGTCTRAAIPGLLYMCRDTSVSVLPLGSTITDTPRRATDATGAGTPGLFDVRSPFNRIIPAPPTPLPTPTVLPHSRPVSGLLASSLVLSLSPLDKQLRTNSIRATVPSSICP